MKSNTLLLALTLSLLTLSCNKRNDSEQASSQDPTTAESSEQNLDLSDTRSARVAADRARPIDTNIDIDKRKAEHQAAIKKAVFDNLGKDEKAGKEAMDKAMQQWINDPVLYGERRYASAEQIKDKQITYHLPAKATKIQLLKEAAGHYALYKISEQDFIDHMVMVWERYREEYVKGGGKRWVKHSDKDVESSLMGRNIGSISYITHGQKQDKKPADKNIKITPIIVPQAIIDSGWDTLQNAVQYQGPIRTNGGISTYYYDRDIGYAFHKVGYW